MIIQNLETLRKALCDTAELDKQKTVASEEMNVVLELLHRGMDENAGIAQDQEEYERKYAALDEHYIGLRQFSTMLRRRYRNRARGIGISHKSSER